MIDFIITKKGFLLLMMLLVSCSALNPKWNGYTEEQLKTQYTHLFGHDLDKVRSELGPPIVEGLINQHLYQIVYLERAATDLDLAEFKKQKKELDCVVLDMVPGREDDFIWQGVLFTLKNCLNQTIPRFQSLPKL